MQAGGQLGSIQEAGAARGQKNLAVACGVDHGGVSLLVVWSCGQAGGCALVFNGLWWWC